MLNQEEMCSDLATQMQDTQLHGNRSCLFFFFFRPQRLGIQGLYRQGLPYVIAL
jgi:hypothetical protein